ncbi:nucleotidyl transferase AbiEii/AbiGii toxin family protein [Patescibacteria group bacterium]|nr:nucleotidyl transferase AbiEii/AbiGii toxin family protein [Patescibacteria group bacterium]MBU2036482.1 nucleotidyl transferase AbiEii/AbiGii toxin family protein [Patescibacteria group bacterium]
MFTKTLLPDTIRAIKLVSNIPIIKKSYLAGGTALALHLGHRISVDLDFFTQEELEEKILLADLQKLPEFKKDGVAWRTVWGKVGVTKFSLFYYKYPLLAKTHSFMGINLLNLKDIAAMKVSALGDRGTKRDFIDLYFLSKKYTLDEMLSFYDQKFFDLNDKTYHLIRSFDYFEDAENDLLPKMLVKVSWNEVKKFFHNESMRLAKINNFL